MRTFREKKKFEKNEGEREEMRKKRKSFKSLFNNTKIDVSLMSKRNFFLKFELLHHITRRTVWRETLHYNLLPFRHISISSTSNNELDTLEEEKK